MQAQALNNLCNSYGLTPIEISCILLNFVMDNKTLAFSYTVGYQSKSKNKDILSGQFFRKERVVKFIAEQRNNYIVNEDSDTKAIYRESDSVTNDQESNTKKEDSVKISSENIQDLLESEYNKTTKQEKKVELLLKIAEFVGAKKNVDDEANSPVIYLPSRCSTCTLRK